MSCSTTSASTNISSVCAKDEQALRTDGLTRIRMNAQDTPGAGRTHVLVRQLRTRRFGIRFRCRQLRRGNSNVGGPNARQSLQPSPFCFQNARRDGQSRPLRFQRRS